MRPNRRNGISQRNGATEPGTAEAGPREPGSKPVPGLDHLSISAQSTTSVVQSKHIPGSV